MSEIERRAQEKFEAAIFRRRRLPTAIAAELEHHRDLREIERQAIKGAKRHDQG